MKQLLKILQSSILLLIVLTLLLTSSVFASSLDKLVILHTNDTHGYDQRQEHILGMATVAALKQSYQEDGYQVILVDAGDAIQDNNLVNFSKGQSAIAFMNAVGYDAMTLGNHEFDYGQDVTLQRVQEANFPVINANITVTATGKTFLPAHTIIQKGDIKIGVFGLTTPETLVSTNPKNVQGLNFASGKDMYATAQKQVNLLKKAGCDVIIALTHLGSEMANLGSRSEDTAANVSGIDIIIDGHDHQEKNLFINQTLIAETGCYTKNIGVVKHEAGQWTSNLIPYNPTLPQDTKVKELVDETANQVENALMQKIGYSSVELNGNRVNGVRTQETNLGDFVTDAILWQAQQSQVLNGTVDAAIFNGGGLRYSLPEGDITKGTIQKILPYNNQLYITQATGAELLETLEASTSVYPEASTGFPQVSGIKFQVNTAVPFAKGEKYPDSEFYIPAKPGSRVTITEVGNQPFDMNKTYVIAMPEFLCNGGDSYGALKPLAHKNARSIGYIDVEAVENYLQSQLQGQIGAEYQQSKQRIEILP